MLDNIIDIFTSLAFPDTPGFLIHIFLCGVTNVYHLLDINEVYLSRAGHLRIT